MAGRELAREHRWGRMGMLAQRQLARARARRLAREPREYPLGKMGRLAQHRLAQAQECKLALEPRGRQLGKTGRLAQRQLVRVRVRECRLARGPLGYRLRRLVLVPLALAPLAPLALELC